MKNIIQEFISEKLAMNHSIKKHAQMNVSCTLSVKNMYFSVQMNHVTTDIRHVIIFLS